MGLDLTGSTQSVCLDDHSSELFRLCRDYEIPAPHLMRIEKEFYSDPVIESSAVEYLKRELQSLLNAHEAVRIPEIKRERRVFSKDLGVERTILEPMLEADPVIGLIRRFIAVCNDALENNTSICGNSD